MSSLLIIYIELCHEHMLCGIVNNILEKIEDTKGVVRNSQSNKDRKYNGQKDK